MDQPAEAFRMEDLLAHRQWVEQLARALVFDRSGADDLSQQAWLEVMERPPAKAPRSPKAWLRTVLRFTAINRLEAERTRRRHEAAAARRVVQESPADVVAQAEVLQRVVRKVLGLKEPYRTTILLRYFGGLEPSAIAARQGVPVETVRTRVKRALQQLRETLDGDGGRNREAWCLALLPLLRRPATAATGMGAAFALGGVLMAKKVALVAAMLALLILGGTLWQSTRPVEPGRPSIPRSLPPARRKAPPVVGPIPTRVVDSPGPAVAGSSRGHRRVSWPVVPGEAPVPKDGTVISLRPIPGANEHEKDLPPGRMVGSDLVVEDLPDAQFWNAIAVAPDGSLARLFVPDGTDRGRETSFRKGRRLEVVLREQDGTALPGAWVDVRESGNNPLAPPAVTDGGGLATFEGLPSYRADVRLVDDKAIHQMGIPIGTVDLEQGDGRLEVTLQPKVRLDLNVSVDGKPSLPEGLTVGFDGVLALERKEDPALPGLRFVLRPGAKVPVFRVYAGGKGLRPGTTVPEWREERGAFVGEVNLSSARGTLLVHMTPPADGGFSWMLYRVDVSGPESLVAGSMFVLLNTPPPKGPPGNKLFSDLQPGRYRLFADSGLATPEVEVRDEGPPAEVSLDLSRTALVTGRVIGPSGFDARRAHVIVEGEGITMQGAAGFSMGSPGPGVPVYGDGTFRVRVPGDRPVRLRAWHPSLVSDPAGGSTEVTEAQEGVVLRLVEGAHAIFRLDPSPKSDYQSWVQVLLFRGDPVGSPVLEQQAESVNGAFRIGGFEPGTYTAWIDAPDSAPLELRGVKLSAEETDLGTLVLEEGATVRLTILVKPGAAVPQIFACARPEGGPSHSRGLNYYGKGEAILRGLGKGRYRVTVTAGSPPTTLLAKDLESEGAGEIPLTLDLR